MHKGSDLERQINDNNYKSHIVGVCSHSDQAQILNWMDS